MSSFQNLTSPNLPASTPTRQAPRPTLCPTTQAAEVRGDSMEGPAPAATPAKSYLCTRCGSTSPYLGRRPRHRGGRGCRACGSVVDAIYAAQMSVYRPLAAEAFKPGVCGETKTRIIAEATRAATEAWRAALDRYGVFPGAAEGQVLA